MSIVVFIVVFALTLFLQRWLHQHIQGLTFAVTGNPGCAMQFLFVLLLPGVILHEASHWVVANILFVRTGKVSLGLSRSRGKQFSLGSVTVERTDPVRESLIGVAPFFVGLVAIVLIAGYGFGLWPNSGLTAREMVDVIVATAGDWLTWVDLYLIFAVSTAMIPSESDREPWGQVLIVFGVIAVIAFFLKWIPPITPEMVHWGETILNGLTFAFGVSVLVNGTVAIFIWIVEWLVASFTQRKVRY